MRVMCNICKKSKGLFLPKKGGKIANLHQHKCFIKLKEQNPSLSNQKTLDGSPIYGPRLDPSKQNDITKKMKNWIVMNEQPFSVVKDKTFRDLLFSLNDSYRPVAVKTIRDGILSDYKLLRDFLKKEIEPIEKFSISFDTFTSDADDHFMDIHIIYFK